MLKLEKERESIRLLITVLTYPHPSKKYTETVCTAGISAEGRWIRLYPLPLRTLPPEQQIRKWQWIQLDVTRASNDKRPESRRPDVDSIQIIGRLDPVKDREERRLWVNKLQVQSLADLERRYEQDKTSLGVLVPRRVLSVDHEIEQEEWSAEQRAKLSQMNLFAANSVRPLQKIPVRFRYKFEDQDGSVRQLTIRDWELGELYRKMREEHGPDEAIRKVKEKYLNQICSPDKDTRFFVGTFYPYNQWMVIGLFWPPKTPDERAGQTSLFAD